MGDTVRGQVSTLQVQQALLPFLGSAFLQEAEEVCARAAQLLAGFRPERDGLAALANQLDTLLFMAVREATQGRMALVMDNGQRYRLRVSDFALMADELLYLLFERLERLPWHQALIREYSMRSGSLAALRALYVRYQDMQSPEENQTLRRVITTCHEPWRWRHWLDLPQAPEQG